MSTQAHATDAHPSRPLALIILDGFGIDRASAHNAIALANTPTLDKLFASCDHCLLDASGTAVGLPEGQMGNSEVGHLTIGSGRIIEQELSRIARICNEGKLLNQEALCRVLEHTQSHNSCLHIMGLVSNGGVHSHIDHLFALIDQALAAGQTHIALHCFTDGRDVSPTSGKGFIEELEAFIAQKHKVYPQSRVYIASLAGRYWAMDRDKRYNRTQRAYNAIACAANYQATLSPVQYIEASYKEGITDEFIEPASFTKHGVEEGDACVFFNFRPDRARQLSHAFVDDAFDAFERTKLTNLLFAGFTCYEEGLECLTVFPKEYPSKVLAEVLSNAGIRQCHIAETEKYAHVSFFFNGGKEVRYPEEAWVLIDSPQVATYDLQPEMSAFKVAESLAAAIRSRESDVYICNFANCDMVGHTGSIAAAIKAVEAVDAALAQVLSALEELEGCALITADHGNADKMQDEEGNPFTAHTTAQVPFILVDYASSHHGFDSRHLNMSDCLKQEMPGKVYGEKLCIPSGGSLRDIAPTMLDFLSIDAPQEMTGKSLLQKTRS